MINTDNPRVLKRFIIYMAALTFVFYTGSWVYKEISAPSNGDMEVRRGDILLTDGKYEKAILAFDQALKISPNHRGALGGKAVALMGMGENDRAEQTLTYLIEYLKTSLTPDDNTGRGALAAAYANRAILKDRQGRYQSALDDYILSAKTDLDLADGPGVMDRIIYYDKKPSSVIARARYLYKQLKLPESERIMRIPEEDAKQRLYKP